MEANAVITGTGTYLPKKAMDNHELAQRVDTSDEWIRTRTGITQRYIANDEETAHFMAKEAAKKALSAANVVFDDIDLIIVATVSGAYAFPSVACFVQRELQKDLGGTKTAPAFDIQAACSGFIYALHMARAQIKTGAVKRALIIGMEKFSPMMDWSDRNTCVLFGDGAGAVVLEETTENVGILSSEIYSEGSGAELLATTGGMSTTGSVGQIIMNGREVYRHAVRRMSEVVKPLLTEANLTVEDIDWVVPHQANMRIIESVAESLGLPKEKCAQTVQTHANTSAASIPLALDALHRDGKIKKGDVVLFTAFGAGFTWGATLMRWA